MGVSAGQFWATDSLGGYLGNTILSKQLRFAASPLMKFRQFVQVKEAVGLHNNDTLVFDVLSAISTAGGALTETNTIPEHRFSMNRGTLTVTEYGNAVPYSGKLDALSEFDVDNAVTRVLRDDQVSVLDKIIGAQFVATKAKYLATTTVAGAITTTGSCTDTGGSDLNPYHIRKMVAQLKKWNVPKYDGQNYICIGSVNALDGIKRCTDWLDAAKIIWPSLRKAA